MMTIGGATRFLTARIITNGIKQTIDTFIAGHSSGPKMIKET